jgi:vanillate O-demethylase ferredoxin subunit
MISVRVTQKKRETLDICSIELKSLDSSALPPFDPGAHIDVCAGGVIRQYSLYNTPDDRSSYRIAVLRETASRGGSAAMHDDVELGDVLQIGAPRNLFSLSADARHSVLLAGGIGITPIACMAQHLYSRNESFDLHYCTRSRERAALKELLTSSLPRESVNFHFDDELDTSLELDVVLANCPPHTHLYVCGPSGFLSFVRSAAAAASFEDRAVHFETFKAAPQENVKSEGFQIQLGRGGRILNVLADMTIAQTLLAEGIDIPISCEQGVCGTCVTAVLDGTPDHRDAFLLPDERSTQITPCCSRSLSPILVLDL